MLTSVVRVAEENLRCVFLGDGKKDSMAWGQVTLTKHTETEMYSFTSQRS